MSSLTVSSTTLLPSDLVPNGVAGSTSPKSRAEIAHAAGEFESILLGQWLQGAESAFGSAPGSTDDADAGDEQMKSFAVQNLAKAFTASGGIGLARIVGEQLQQTQMAGYLQQSPAEKATK